MWEISRPVEDPMGNDCRGLIADLNDTLADFRNKNGFGRGIAAPQIGVLSRVIFVRTPEPGFSGALVNPVITETDATTIEVWDDCFSVPGLMVRLKRTAKVRVKYLDEQGRHRSVDADGALSELLQHETDHLDGILTVDRAKSAKDICSREEWLRRYGRPATS
ncbi:MAG: peptide deformylase [candidate division Zixibacteria bacterium]|nr:peptide deformylase [candidate division Zixibacteria bacterium]